MLRGESSTRRSAGSCGPAGTPPSPGRAGRGCGWPSPRSSGVIGTTPRRSSPGLLDVGDGAHPGVELAAEDEEAVTDEQPDEAADDDVAHGVGGDLDAGQRRLDRHDLHQGVLVLGGRAPALLDPVGLHGGGRDDRIGEDPGLLRVRAGGGDLEDDRVRRHRGRDTRAATWAGVAGVPVSSIARCATARPVTSGRYESALVPPRVVAASPSPDKFQVTPHDDVAARVGEVDLRHPLGDHPGRAGADQREEQQAPQMWARESLTKSRMVTGGPQNRQKHDIAAQ